MSDLPSTSSTPKQSASPDALIDRLFQKLHTMYGKAWLDLWIGVPIDAVKAEWARTLHGVEPETMRLALDSMATEGRAFPPNLPEFVALCRQFVRKGPHRLSLAAPRHDAPDGAIRSLRQILDQAGRKA